MAEGAIYVKGFQRFDKIDEPVKRRHPGESRGPVLSEKTGFRVKHGMTNKGKIDFLRGRQNWIFVLLGRAYCCIQGGDPGTLVPGDRGG